jgi:hypothetical protein
MVDRPSITGGLSGAEALGLGPRRVAQACAGTCGVSGSMVLVYTPTYMTGWFMLGKCWDTYSSTMEHMGYEKWTTLGIRRELEQIINFKKIKKGWLNCSTIKVNLFVGVATRAGNSIDEIRHVTSLFTTLCPSKPIFLVARVMAPHTYTWLSDPIWVIYRKPVAVMAFPMVSCLLGRNESMFFFPSGGPAGSQSGLREASFEATEVFCWEGWS